MQLDYWRGKYERFTMAEIPEGFSNRQRSTSASSANMRLYLKTVLTESIRSRVPRPPRSARCGDCRRSMPARSARTTSTTASTPSRSPVSAAGSTTAGRNMSPTRSDTATAKAANPLEKPWPTFTGEDVKAAADELLVAHHARQHDQTDAQEVTGSRPDKVECRRGTNLPARRHGSLPVASGYLLRRY